MTAPITSVRFVRPIPNGDLHAIFGQPQPVNDNIDRLRERVAYRNRIAKRQRWIGLACCALSAAAMLYFIGQIVRWAVL